MLPVWTSILTLSWSKYHDNVMAWEHFPHYWPCGYQKIPSQRDNSVWVDLLFAWRNYWINSLFAGDLRRHAAPVGLVENMSAVVQAWTTSCRWATRHLKLIITNFYYGAFTSQIAVLNSNAFIFENAPCLYTGENQIKCHDINSMWWYTVA